MIYRDFGLVIVLGLHLANLSYRGCPNTIIEKLCIETVKDELNQSNGHEHIFFSHLDVFIYKGVNYI